MELQSPLETYRDDRSLVVNMAGSERTAVHSSGAEMLRNDTIDEKAICDEGQGAVAILPDLNHIDKSEVLRKVCASQSA